MLNHKYKIKTVLEFGLKSHVNEVPVSYAKQKTWLEILEMKNNLRVFFSYQTKNKTFFLNISLENLCSLRTQIDNFSYYSY